MHYGLTKTPKLQKQDCLVLGILSDQSLPTYIADLLPNNEKIINKLAKKLNDSGDIIWQSELDGISILLIHCGKKAEFKALGLQKRLDTIIQELIKQHTHSALIALPQVQDLTADEQVERMVLQADYVLYQMLDYKTSKATPHVLQSVEFLLPDAQSKDLKNALAVAQGVRLARNLANQPANVCTPTYLAEQATKLHKEYNSISTHIHSEADLKKMGMGSFLAVAQGSAQTPKLVELHYNKGAKNVPTIVLVGKGITFDSGGISLKPAPGMEEMKFDMAGAASVLGTIKACALMQLPLHIVGLLACAENMPSGTATKPGDVVTSMSGLTIEITNTDAEGRLVLADALTYAEKFKPDFVIDIATLTGAIIIALGHENTGLMTQDEQLANLILKAGRESGDKVWRMPLEEAYDTCLDSPIADMANAAADRTAGSVGAACFLSRFTKKYPWAHLDIAGTAWVPGKKRNATGRPVSLLSWILRDAANSR